MASAPSSQDEQLIDLGETARRLGVHYMTAYRYVRTGRLPAAQHDGRWRVNPAELGKLRPGPAEAGLRRGRGRPQARHGMLRARLLAGDEPGAWRIVETLLASGAEPSTVLVNVLAGALRDIGDGWESGELTVGDEHRATAVGIRLVGRLGATSTRVLPEGGESAARNALEKAVRAARRGSQDRDDLAADQTTRLSPYRHFGCLSALHVARRFESVDPDVVRQLAWRDSCIR